MNFTFKNQKLPDFLEEHRQKGEEIWKAVSRNCSARELPGELKAWLADHPESSLYGFFETLTEVAQSRGIPLDLTYRTAHFLPLALETLYGFQKDNGMEDLKNLQSIPRHLGAYLTILAMNEHNCWFKTKTFPQGRQGLPLWSDRYSIMTGKKRSLDLLPACTEALTFGTLLSKDGFTLRMEPVAEVYRTMTGVDLLELGLENLYVNG